MVPHRATALLVVLALLAVGLPAGAVTLEDLVYDPEGDVVDGATNGTVSLPGIDVLNARVDDLAGDLEVSITLAGAPKAEGTYTVNVMVDSTYLFSFSRSSLGDFTASDPVGSPVAVIGWLDPDRVAWEVSTDLLSVKTGLAIDSVYTYVTNGTGAVLQDILEVNQPNGQPYVEITSHLGGETLEGTVEIRGTASDDGGVTMVMLRVDDGEWTPVNGTESWDHDLDTTTLPDGPYWIEARASDGQLYSEVDRLFVVVDNVPGEVYPMTVAITWPLDGARVDGTVNVTGTATPAGGVSGINLRIDGGDWFWPQGNTSWWYDLDTTVLADGQHWLEAKSLGYNRAESSVASTMMWVGEGPPPDNLPPTVLISSPTEGKLMDRSREAFRFSGTVLDDVGATRVEVRLNGSEEWDEATLSDSSWSLDLTLFHLEPDAPNFVEARAFDGELYSDVARVNFKMRRNSAPHISLEVLEKTSDELVMGGVANDEADAITKVEVRFDDYDWQDIQFQIVEGDPSSVEFEYSLSLMGLPEEEEHTLEFRATDSWGSRGTEHQTFERFKTHSGTDPKAPGPGPLAALLALAAIALLLRGRRFPRRGPLRPM